MRRSMESISLWHCSGVMEAQVALIAAFRSSAMLGLVSLIFLLTIPHRLLMHWLQLQFTPCEALPSVWICFAWQYSQACGHPCCLCTFFYPISSFQSTLHIICFDTALREQPPLSVITLCDVPSLWRVSMIVFWNNFQVSSVPHYCAFKEQEIPIIYTVWMVSYWNSNVNFLIFWDTDFLLASAVSSNLQNKNKTF